MFTGLFGLCSRVEGWMGKVMEKRFDRDGVGRAEFMDSAARDMVRPWLWKLVRPEEPDFALAESLVGEATCSAGKCLASEAP